MATLAVRLADLATRIATECKAIRTLLNNNAADNSALITTAKANLVAAINEVKTQANALASSSGALINDSSNASTTETYSITKIKSELASTAAAVKNELLGGAGAAYDTLKELQDLITGSASDVTNIMTALGKRVRVDAAQSFTTPEQAQARSNIGALSAVEIGDPDQNLVTVFNTGLT